MTANSNALHKAWEAAWRGIGAAGNGAKVRDAVWASYAEPHRRYHTRQHLGECLALLDAVAGLAVHPAEVGIALWFHDAIYDVRGDDNEARSADWLAEATLAAGARPDAVQRMHQLVLATRHQAALAARDAQLMVDIDLAILGAAPLRFIEYEQQIREEYRHVPDALFAEKRNAVLRSFLRRPRLYHTDYFFHRYEHQARDNMNRSLLR